MSWEDAAQLESRLKRALDVFDWEGAATIINEAIDRINNSQEKIPEMTAKRLMASLRKKRRFTLMRELAEAIINSGVHVSQVQRQFAQALIDGANLAEAEGILHAIIQDPASVAGEIIEAGGLLGRVYKQRYVNNGNTPAEENAANLRRALELYYEPYRVDPKENLWHGINVVALSARARRDGLSFEVMRDELALARQILATIADKEAQSTVPLKAYDEATRMEAYIALGQYHDAEDSALRYIDSIDADAFELKSTIRQLEEVWQLNYNQAPGNHLLPLLKANQLCREGGFANRKPEKVAEESAAVGLAIKDLEAKFGGARTVTLIWYKKGLDRCKSVARIEKLSGKGHGTGWLVKADDFFPGREGVLLLTNEHVISKDPDHPTAILPEDARANFQAVGEKGEIVKIKEVVWSSPHTDLDATFVTLEKTPEVEHLELLDRAVRMPKPPDVERLYIIGYPQAGDLQFSIEDNHLLACNDRLLHYRTPTEPGSSGSPVFESEDWRVVALHHGGRDTLKRIDGVAGTYEANEGIAIRAIRQGIQAG